MILGVTGGIATGKSSVTEMFRNVGVPVVSADELAREVVEPGSETLNALVNRFGPNVLCADGTLDRRKLSAIVFKDASARSDLNRLTHPAIARLAESRLAALQEAGASHIVYEAPLLYEAGAESRVDKVLVVTAHPAVQKRRLIARDGLSGTAAEARIDSQMPIDEKISRADFVIDNSGTLAETERQVKALCRELSIPVSG